MAEVMTMVQLSPTMEEGRLVAWLKKEGESVEAGEVVAEVETDKANMDMESFFDGVILKILLQEDDAASVGTPMAIIGEEGEDISDVLAELEGGGGTSDSAKQDEAPPNPKSAETAESTDTIAESAPATPAREDGRILSSPLARKLAADKGIDLASIKGSGPGGRIVKKDVEAAEPAAKPAAAAPSVSAPSITPAPILPSALEGDTVNLSPMRKSIAKNLTAAWQAPAFMLTREIDMGPAMALRKQINAKLADAETGKKISVNDMIIKACAMALIDEPAMNVAYQGDHLVQYNTADIGVAVALDGGLITPIVRAAHIKSVTSIAGEVREMAGRARDKKLKPEEYSGSTFSISNLGMFGIDHFTAVLNPPAAGILAVGTVKKVPVVGEDGELTVGTRMNVTLTCDHRAVDGAVGALFLKRVVEYLENPMLILV